MTNVTWQFQAVVPGGPSLTLNQPSLDVSGYDVVSVEVPGATNNFAIAVQPSAGAGTVILMIVSSSQYDPGISYTVDAVGVSHVLDGPHVLVGSGAVSLLNSGAPPQKLIFNNTLANAITVQVLAGRKIP
jgi:hypothetical protein